jgi:ketopantoate reductase
MKLRIAVVGSGAIGSYYWAKLAYGGSDVHFLESAAAFEQIKRTEKMSAYCSKPSTQSALNLLMNTKDGNVL